MRCLNAPREEAEAREERSNLQMEEREEVARESERLREAAEVEREARAELSARRLEEEAQKRQEQQQDLNRWALQEFKLPLHQRSFIG